MNKTRKNTWKKAGKRKQNFQKKKLSNDQIITACLIELSSTRNDYEQKINYDWPQ